MLGTQRTQREGLLFLFLRRREAREKNSVVREKQRLAAFRTRPPQLGTEPATQSCALVQRPFGLSDDAQPTERHRPRQDGAYQSLSARPALFGPILPSGKPQTGAQTCSMDHCCNGKTTGCPSVGDRTITHGTATQRRSPQPLQTTPQPLGAAACNLFHLTARKLITEILQHTKKYILC